LDRDPDWIGIRIVIQPKMLDPDPESMNPDPQHCKELLRNYHPQLSSGTILDSRLSPFSYIFFLQILILIGSKTLLSTEALIFQDRKDASKQQKE
jgi:hypothetical protein